MSDDLSASLDACAQALLFALSGARDRWAAVGNEEMVADCDASMRKCAAMMDRWDVQRAAEALT